MATLGPSFHPLYAPLNAHRFASSFLRPKTRRISFFQSLQSDSGKNARSVLSTLTRFEFRDWFLPVVSQRQRHFRRFVFDGFAAEEATWFLKLQM